jgi:type I protein arginine methyltransferase
VGRTYLSLYLSLDNDKIISLRTAPNGRVTKMSIHLPATSLDLVEDGSEPESDSEASNAEDTWSDWVSDSGRRCKSLFEDKLLASVTEALDYDKKTYGFDLDSFCKEKGG